jgi:hypothetical protein
MLSNFRLFCLYGWPSWLFSCLLWSFSRSIPFLARSFRFYVRFKSLYNLFARFIPFYRPFSCKYHIGPNLSGLNLMGTEREPANSYCYFVTFDSRLIISLLIFWRLWACLLCDQQVSFYEHCIVNSTAAFRPLLIWKYLVSGKILCLKIFSKF